MNTGQRLVALSGLTGVSAAQHLLAIRVSGANAGEILVSRSALATGSAMDHLLSDVSPPEPVDGMVSYIVFARRVGRR